MLNVCRICLFFIITDEEYYEIENNRPDLPPSTNRYKIKRLFPNMNLDLCAKQVMCKTCHDELEAVYKFETKVLKSEHIIKTYLKKNNAYVKDVDLTQVALVQNGMHLSGESKIIEVGTCEVTVARNNEDVIEISDDESEDKRKVKIKINENLINSANDYAQMRNVNVQQELVVDNRHVKMQQELVMDNRNVNMQQELVMDNRNVKMQQELVLDNRNVNMQQALLMDNRKMKMQQELVMDNRNVNTQQELVLDNGLIQEQKEKQMVYIIKNNGQLYSNKPHLLMDEKGNLFFHNEAVNGQQNNCSQISIGAVNSLKENQKMYVINQGGQLNNYQPYVMLGATQNANATIGNTKKGLRKASVGKKSVNLGDGVDKQANVDVESIMNRFIPILPDTALKSKQIVYMNGDSFNVPQNKLIPINQSQSVLKLNENEVDKDAATSMVMPKIVSVKSLKGEKKNDCKTCTKKISKIDSLQDKQCLRKDSNGRISTTYTCSRCAKIFPTFQKLWAHINHHCDKKQETSTNRMKRYRCEECKRAVGCGSNLYLCTLCDHLKINTFINYKWHMRHMHNLEPYHCWRCGLRFSTRSCLFDHACAKGECQNCVWVPQNLKIIKCRVCPESFKEYQGLKKHVHKAHGVGGLCASCFNVLPAEGKHECDYLCAICYQLFQDKHVLENHKHWVEYE